MFSCFYTALIHTQASPLIQKLSSLCPFAISQHLFLNFSLILPQFHGKRAGQQKLRVKEKRGERDREGGEREKGWKPRSRTGKLIFFFGTLLLTASGIEYKLINLPGCTCHDTQGKPGIRHGIEEGEGDLRRNSVRAKYLGLHSFISVTYSWKAIIREFLIL